MSETLLKIDDISVNYGHITALIDASIEAQKSQIVSIIGSNGAGKTTLLRTISGLVKPKSGSITMNGEQIIGVKPNKIVKCGIVHVPEGRKVFSGLTVRDNLLVGGYLYSGAELQKTLDETFELFPILKEREKQYAGTLSGGEQQMLAIGRGMMSHPKIMLLDEPSLGLAPIIINNVFNYIKTIRDSGVTILLVEQNAKKALETCDTAYVLENGRITLSGSGDELLHSPAVIAAYLGEQRK
ncbi:MAG: ABC transporter ATP-binding protein [Oscillospiraceae bacterium]|nr:ABC transporter ATP-binding protein [Oscillospiraceae bacterium]